MPQQPSVDQDIRAIKALNQHDVRAVLASDFDAIVSQWTDDFVVIPPAGPIVRGRAANAAPIESAKKQGVTFEHAEYSVDFEEIVVAGDYAFEWGTFKGAMRPPGGSAVEYGGKLMRILQRQRDGSWKMHRTIMTHDAA
jgi:uncharacterized protein (TIGR02246 family)